MITALERSVVLRDDVWTIDREMSAVTAEILHAFMFGYFRAHGAKNLGKSLHIERPWEKNKKKEFVSPGAFAAMIGGGNA